MTEKKRDSSPSLADWAKFEAYDLTAQDYADMPEWSDEQIAHAQVSVGGTVIRPASGTFASAPQESTGILHKTC